MEPKAGKMKETPSSGSGRERAGHGGTVNPPRVNRKGGAGNPPPEGETRSRASSLTKLLRIAETAKTEPEMVFTSVGHLLDVDLLREAYGRTRKDASAGIDGQTAEDYGKDLKRNLEGLVARLKAKRYRAPAVRRTYIPKGQGNEMRPIGIPTFEDKVLQRAVAMILEAIYEPIFSDDSYGFRPGRGCHDALQVMRERIMSMRGYWVIEVDIRKFFDSLDHSQLMAILRRRVRDGTVLRLIGKWLKAGVLDKETLFFPGAGTPQGGVISPILGNIYLHTVLDEWFHELVRPVLHGRAFLVRYADDFVMGFEREDDADRVLRTLPLRFEKYGLRLHPLKTGQIDFRPPWRRRQEKCPQPRPRRSFDFLGFTVYWGAPGVVGMRSN